MIFRRHRFGDLVRRQLDLFEEDEAALLREAETAAAAYDDADRDEAEEAYSDYQLVLEALDGDAREGYEQTFERAARKRFPTLTAGL